MRKDEVLFFFQRKADFVLLRLDGYIGGSSAERFPIEDAVPKAAEAFKSVRRS